MEKRWKPLFWMSLSVGNLTMKFFPKNLSLGRKNGGRPNEFTPTTRRTNVWKKSSRSDIWRTLKEEIQVLSSQACETLETMDALTLYDIPVIIDKLFEEYISFQKLISLPEPIVQEMCLRTRSYKSLIPIQMEEDLYLRNFWYLDLRNVALSNKAYCCKQSSNQGLKDKHYSPLED